MKKIIVGALAVPVAVLTVFVGFASATPATPSSTASDLFADSWPEALSLFTTLAPLVIGAGLMLLAIRKVVRAVSKGRAPSI